MLHGTPCSQALRTPLPWLAGKEQLGRLVSEGERRRGCEDLGVRKERKKSDAHPEPQGGQESQPGRALLCSSRPLKTCVSFRRTRISLLMLLLTVYSNKNLTIPQPMPGLHRIPKFTVTETRVLPVVPADVFLGQLWVPKQDNPTSQPVST